MCRPWNDIRMYILLDRRATGLHDSVSLIIPEVEKKCLITILLRPIANSSNDMNSHLYHNNNFNIKEYTDVLIIGLPLFDYYNQNANFPMF